MPRFSNSLMKPRFWLLFALLMAGLLVFAGCAGAPIRGWSGPVAVEDALYVGTMQGKVVSFTLVSEPRPAAVEWWRFPPRGQPGLGGGVAGGFLACGPAPAAGIYSTPFVANGVVYIGTYNGKVYAIDASTGTEIWEYPYGDLIGPIVGSPVVDGGILYIGSSDGKLYALDAEIGHKQWEFQTGDDVWATPAVYGGVVYIGSLDHNLYAIDAGTGTEKWRFETQGAIAATPLIYNDTIYIGSFDRRFYAINLDGSEKWHFDAAGNWFWSKAVVHDDTIIAGCLDSWVYAFDAQSGAQAWPPFETGGQIRADPVLVGDLVIIGSEDGTVYALDAGTGALAWAFAADAPIRAPLFAELGTIFERLKKIVVDQLGVEEERVVPSASFVEDLNADSSDLAELIMAIEEEFSSDTLQIRISNEDAEGITTVQAAIDYLKELGIEDEENKVYVHTTVGTLYALEAERGTPSWPPWYTPTG